MTHPHRCRSSTTRRLRPALLTPLAAALLALGVAPKSAQAQLYVSSYFGNNVGEYSATTGASINPSLITGLNNPTSLTLSGNNLFVANFAGGFNPSTVGVYNATTGAPINAGLVNPITGPVGVVLSGNTLLVAANGFGLGNGTVGAYSASTGAAINANFITNLQVLNGMALAGNNLYLSTGTAGPSSNVGVYNASTGAAINANFITGLNSPFGLAVSGNKLFVALEFANTVAEYNASTGLVINANFITGLNNPGGLLVSGNDLYVTNYGGGTGTTVGEYNATTGAPINASLITGLNGPLGLALVGASAPGAPIIIAYVGSLIQNSAPVDVPTTADFIVNGPGQTGGPNESNTIHSLFFLPDSSLLIHNTLYVTQGPVVLPGNSSITLDGSLSVSELQMLAGSFLNGNGNILGNLINGGTVQPGDAPGQIHVTGSYVQTPTGRLTIEIGGLAFNQHSLLSVDGSAQLGGTLQLVPIAGYKLERNHPVTFLTASGGVFGRFATVLDGFTSDTILQPTVIYSRNNVALEAVQGSFAQFAQAAGLTPNERAVAAGLDSAAANPRFNSLFDYLDNRQLGKLPADFDRISPEGLTSIFTISTAYAQQQSLNLQRRTDDIRSGAGWITGPTLAINGNNPSYSGPLDITTGVTDNGNAGPTGADGKEVKEDKGLATEHPWGAFVSGTGEWVNVSGTDNARGYDLTSGGFTLGVDYRVTSNFAIGLAAGYTGTTADLNDHGRVWVNGGKLGLYSTVFSGGWYADMAGFGGYNGYDTRRSALQGEARGNTHGGEVDALFGTGYDFTKGNFTFGPTATFDYTYAGVDGFTEHDSLAPLNIHGGNEDSLRTAFGLKVSYDWKLGGVIIKPELRAAWQHEFGDATYALDSSFANGSPFNVSGPRFGRDSALLGAGVAVQLTERCTAYLYYDGNIGRTNYQSESITGGFRVAF
ncbi:MAG TPA: autotransporter domain-containing protein [Chthoniobacter sp.]